MAPSRGSFLRSIHPESLVTIGRQSNRFRNAQQPVGADFQAADPSRAFGILPLVDFLSGFLRQSAKEPSKANTLLISVIVPISENFRYARSHKRGECRANTIEEGKLHKCKEFAYSPFCYSPSVFPATPKERRERCVAACEEGWRFTPAETRGVL
jgi:hypothetical protein